MNRQIPATLISLAQHDLDVRERLIQEDKLSQGGYNPEMEAVHLENSTHLREIINLVGWPTISKVGEEASEAAWLIVQHAIGEPKFMKKCYALMQEAGEDINPRNLAYLYDRICYFEGRPQKYGTQYDDGVLYPVEDKNAVNALRQQIGMKPIPGKNVKDYQGDGAMPDLHTDTGFNEWRKKVGWIK